MAVAPPIWWPCELLRLAPNQGGRLPRAAQPLPPWASLHTHRVSLPPPPASASLTFAHASLI
jgi:hypothetical protein